MLCGALREKSTYILILLLCIVAFVVANFVIASERHTTGMLKVEAIAEFISNHRIFVSKRMRKYEINHQIKDIDTKHSLKDISDAHDWQMNQGRATLHETKKSNLVRDEVEISRTRQKRSFGFEIVSDGIIPEGASMDMNTAYAKRKPARKLYHKSSSTLLQILPNGDITGAAIFNKYCILLLKSVDHVDNKTLLKILGNSTGRYIAMSSKGILYTTKDLQNKETNFLHEYSPDTHDAYISQEYGRYITFAGSNGRSSPRKARIVRGNITPRGSRFLLMRVSEADMQRSEKEKSHIDYHPAAKNRKKHRKCGKRKKKSCKRKSRLRKTKQRRRGKTRKKMKRHKRRSDHTIFSANSRQDQNRAIIKTDYVDVT